MLCHDTLAEEGTPLYASVQAHCQFRFGAAGEPADKVTLDAKHVAFCARGCICMQQVIVTECMLAAARHVLKCQSLLPVSNTRSTPSIQPLSNA